MPRAKHGRYDSERNLPDNTGQPQGSGLIVWFHSQILEHLGDAAGQSLIDESRAQGSRGTAWLLVQLTAKGHSEIVEAYEQCRRADAAALRRRDKERIIAQCQATIARNDTPPEHQAFLRKAIAKAQKYLEEHAEDANG